MLLDSNSPKYLGNEEGLLNIELLRKLYHVIAFNLAKSRAAQDGNKYTKENYHPRLITLEWAKLLVTYMEEQEYNNREIENRKAYLESIEVYEGTDKQKCLPWVNQLQQAAKCSNTSL